MSSKGKGLEGPCIVLDLRFGNPTVLFFLFCVVRLTT